MRGRVMGRAYTWLDGVAGRVVVRRDDGGWGGC